MLIKLQNIGRSSELLVMRLILSTFQRAENKRKAVVFSKNEYLKGNLKRDVSTSI